MIHSQNMNICPLFATKEREKILDYLLEHPSERINMNGLARKLHLSPGQIHKYITILRKAGLVEKDTIKETPLTGVLRLTHNLKRIAQTKLVDILRRGFPRVKGIGIYGSWASGTNLEDADLDIWLKIEKEPADENMAKMRKKLEKKLGIPVDIVIATPERLKHFQEKSDSFYFSLYHGRILWGEGL
ncbi:MAG: nucleotidyltransferase domain-containing protein [Candidatus Micrarchaeota archaeon]